MGTAEAAVLAVGSGSAGGSVYVSLSDKDLRHLERGTALWKAVMLRGRWGLSTEKWGALYADTLHLLTPPRSQGGNGAEEYSRMTTRQKK